MIHCTNIKNLRETFHILWKLFVFTNSRQEESEFIEYLNDFSPIFWENSSPEDELVEEEDNDWENTVICEASLRYKDFLCSIPEYIADDTIEDAYKNVGIQKYKCVQFAKYVLKTWIPPL